MYGICSAVETALHTQKLNMACTCTASPGGAHKLLSIAMEYLAHLDQLTRTCFGQGCVQLYFTTASKRKSGVPGRHSDLFKVLIKHIEEVRTVKMASTAHIQL